MRIVITVDGEPAVAIAPVDPIPITLTTRELRVAQALESAILTAGQLDESFDAVELIRDGRR